MLSDRESGECARKLNAQSARTTSRKPTGERRKYARANQTTQRAPLGHGSTSKQSALTLAHTYHASAVKPRKQTHQNPTHPSRHPLDVLGLLKRRGDPNGPTIAELQDRLELFSTLRDPVINALRTSRESELASERVKLLGRWFDDTKALLENEIAYRNAPCDPDAEFAGIGDDIGNIFSWVFTIARSWFIPQHVTERAALSSSENHEAPASAEDAVPNIKREPNFIKGIMSYNSPDFLDKKSDLQGVASTSTPQKKQAIIGLPTQQSVRHDATNADNGDARMGLSAPLNFTDANGSSPPGSPKKSTVRRVTTRHPLGTTSVALSSPSWSPTDAMMKRKRSSLSANAKQGITGPKLVSDPHKQKTATKKAVTRRAIEKPDSASEVERMVLSAPLSSAPAGPSWTQPKLASSSRAKKHARDAGQEEAGPSRQIKKPRRAD